jgi:hypothetical protein
MRGAPASSASALVIATVVVGRVAVTTHGQEPSMPPGMRGATAAPSMARMWDQASVPAVHGFYAGAEILFIGRGRDEQGRRSGPWIGRPHRSDPSA